MNEEAWGIVGSVPKQGQNINPSHSISLPGHPATMQQLGAMTTSTASAEQLKRLIFNKRSKRNARRTRRPLILRKSEAPPKSNGDWSKH